MTVNLQKRKKVDSHPLENTNYMNDRIGFWGNVCEVDSTLNQVSVIACTGQKFIGLPVCSDEWVNADENKDYVSAGRNLPRVGSRVFVLMPTHTISGAFVLCSGYAYGEDSTLTLLADKENKDKENEIQKKVDQAGWKYTEYYENGNKVIESNDEDIRLEIALDTNDDFEKKRVYLKAWNNTFELVKNNDGDIAEIKILDRNIKLENNKTTIETDGHKIISDSNGIELYKDKNSTSANYIKLGTKIEMKGTTGTVEIS